MKGPLGTKKIKGIFLENSYWLKFCNNQLSICNARKVVPNLITFGGCVGVNQNVFFDHLNFFIKPLMREESQKNQICMSPLTALITATFSVHITSHSCA